MIFRGVVRGGVFNDIDNCALIVSHPHPSNDFGGGPGPVNDWNQPWEDDAYSSLVDDDFDPADAYFEVRDYRHLAVRKDGVWSLHEIPEHGTIDWFDRHGAIISYGGNSTCSAELENGRWKTFTFAGLPPMAFGLHARRADGDSLLISFQVDTSTRAVLAKRDGNTVKVTEDLGETPGRILAKAGETIVAGGDGLWARVNDKWTRLSRRRNHVSQWISDWRTSRGNFGWSLHRGNGRRVPTPRHRRSDSFSGSLRRTLLHRRSRPRVPRRR